MSVFSNLPEKTCGSNSQHMPGQSVVPHVESSHQVPVVDPLLTYPSFNPAML